MQLQPEIRKIDLSIRLFNLSISTEAHRISNTVHEDFLSIACHVLHNPSLYVNFQVSEIYRDKTYPAFRIPLTFMKKIDILDD